MQVQISLGIPIDLHSVSINAAYVSSHSELKKLATIRNQLEEELKITIPIMIMLKGKVIRVGPLSQP